MRKSVRERSPWIVGIISILAIGLGVGLAFSVNRFSFIKGVYPIYADLQDAAGLIPGNEVRVAGVKVGTVTQIVLTEDAARIKMEIERDVQLPEETRLEVKLKTLLGQKFIDLQMPKSYLTAAAGEGNPASATGGYLSSGDVIPLDQTRIPYEIHQAATEGTEKLAAIDKRALRKMLGVLANTVGASKEELGRLIVSLDEAGVVLEDKGPEISALLRNAEKVSDTLAASDKDFDAILKSSAEVFDTLADERATTSSLLAATNDLTKNLGLLLQVARGSFDAGVSDLSSVLSVLNQEYASIDTALGQLAVSQELFGRPLKFGRFVEGHVCAITTEDVCVPWGTPEVPEVPVKGTQPLSVPAYAPGPLR
ncbi:MAG: MCE family protein [Actinobacteria bacterium]|nr:MCE family protein [Actinomycetota bacterium]